MQKIAEETLGSGKWLSLKRSTFVDDRGQQFSWEHIERIGTKHAVVIFAVTKPSDEVVLIRQFRPGANAFVLGLPAGMAEPESASAGEDALRELKEETGYIGTLVEVGPVVSSFPAHSDATVQLVRMEIDESLPQNQRPEQALEPGEIIETLRVPLRDLRSFVRKEAASGTQVVSGLGYLCALCP